MTVPNWYTFTLLGLAAFRTFKLLSDDVILDKPRAWFIYGFRKWRGNSTAEYVSDFISCPYCLGAHVSIAWWLCFELLSEHWTTVVAVPFALSAVVALITHFGTD